MRECITSVGEYKCAIKRNKLAGLDAAIERRKKRRKKRRKSRSRRKS